MNDNITSDSRRSTHRPTIFALAFVIVFPSILTWVYFVLMASWPAAAQQAAYGTLKAIQFALPFVWTAIFFRGRLKSLIPFSSPAFEHPDLVKSVNIANADTPKLSSLIKLSIGFGLLVTVGVFGGYWLFSSWGLIDEQLTIKIKEKVSGMNLDTPLKFAGLGVFYALVHSYLEEYYWRWFVFVRLQDYWSPAVANVVSSLGFMAHHVILLATFFGWSSPLTWFLSGCVAIGGVVWAWLYGRRRLLVVPWISHLMVDAAIFGLGYFLVFGWPGQ